MPRIFGKVDKHDPKTWFWPFGQPQSLKEMAERELAEKEENEKSEKNVGKP